MTCKRFSTGSTSTTTVKYVIRCIPSCGSRLHSLLRFLLLFVAASLVASAEFVADTHSAAAGEQLRQVEIVAEPKGVPVDATFGPLIPGLDQDAVPQGLAYLPERDWFLISLYREEPPRAAFIVAVEAADEKRVVRCLTLLNDDGSQHKGHVGGIAVDDRWVWIGSTPDVFKVPLDAVLGDDEHDTVCMTKVFKPPCSPSFVAVHDATLWAGEFVDHSSSKYPGCKKSEMRDRRGEPVRAWLAGYALGKDGAPTATAAADDQLVPDKLFSIPEKAQGVAFHGGLVLVSTSSGKPKSHLRAFANPLSDAAAKPHDTVQFGQTAVSLWFLDATEAPRWIPPALPPRAEGIAVRNDKLAVLFESGARAYRDDAAVIDRLLFLPIRTGD